jgi:hypothetical protein
MAKQKTHIKVKIRIPHVIIDARGADPALVEAVAPGLQDLDARIRVLGKGAKQLPHAFSLEEAMEEAHIWVVLGKKLPSEFSMLIEKGVVPVMPQGIHEKAENYSASQEKGNAFLFSKLTEWHVYGSLIRALENFGFSYDWSNLKNHCKELL